MEKKKFMDGTELGSKREPATNASSAPDGTVTGPAKLDVTTFGDVSGGRLGVPVHYYAVTYSDGTSFVQYYDDR